MDILGVAKTVSLETWVAFRSLNLKPEHTRVILVGQGNKFP